MKQLNYKPLLPRRFGILLAFATLIAAIITPVMANASSQSFYVLDNKAQPGMLMSQTANAGVAEAANDKNSSSLIGVIAPDDTSLDKQPGQISIKTDGVTNALVSTLGGDINVGDRITSSSLVGVGSKLKTSGWIVGVAQASLDAKTKGAITSDVTDSKGDRHEVYVASIPLAIKATYYVVPGSTPKQTLLIPKSIQALADALAGKHVSILALLLSFLLLLAGIMSAAIVINGSVRSYFKGISRQPLAKSVLFRKLLQTFGMTGLILAAVCIGAFMLLRII